MEQKTVVQILRSPSGGTRKHVYDILGSLSNSEFKQIFISNFDEADYRIPDTRNLKQIHCPIEDQPSVKDIVNLFKIYLRLYDKKIDVIHGHGAKGGIYARILAFFLRTKSIYTPHGGSLHRVYGKIKNSIYDAIELFMIPFTDVLLFESKYSRDMYSKNVLSVHGKMIVNYNGIEIPQVKEPKVYVPGERIDFVSFGLLRHLKGHDIGIETCRLLKQESLPFTYTIYGKGEELDTLKRLIASYDLENEVKILDFTNKVYDEMLKYHFIYHPSRFEALPYVPIEGMMLGIPAITSSVGGIPEIVDETCGYRSEANIPEEYFNIFMNIVQGKADYKALSEKSKSIAHEKFSKQTMIRKIAELYRS